MLPNEYQWVLKLQIGGKDILILSSESEPFVNLAGKTAFASRIISAANVYMTSCLAVGEMSNEVCLRQLGLQD